MNQLIRWARSLIASSRILFEFTLLGDNDPRSTFSKSSVLQPVLWNTRYSATYLEAARNIPQNELLSIPSVKGFEWRWLSFRHHWAAAGRIGAQGTFDILRKGLECGGKCQRYLLDVG
jgi:hypothetical protein